MGCNKCNKKSVIFKLSYIRNFFKFLFTNIKLGFKKVGYDKYLERKAICRGCPFFNSEAGRCMDCGCWINTKAKFKSETCPQGYW